MRHEIKFHKELLSEFSVKSFEALNEKDFSVRDVHEVEMSFFTVFLYECDDYYRGEFMPEYQIKILDKFKREARLKESFLFPAVSFSRYLISKMKVIKKYISNYFIWDFMAFSLVPFLSALILDSLLV